jgi:predicted small lipoprotein YifL
MDLRKRRQPLKLLLYLFILMVLASCGQKGDLYLPDKGKTSLAQHHLRS